MDNRAYAVQLCALQEYAKERGIPPHHFAIRIKDKEHIGVTLDLSNIEDLELAPEEAPPTLLKLNEMAFLHFPNENHVELFAVFGRVADGPIPKTVAHVELRKHLARGVLDHVVVRSLS